MTNNVIPSDDQMQKLECPFTWITKDIIKEDDLEYHLSDDEDLFPLLQLIRCMMTVYVNVKAKTESEEILKGLKKCDEIMDVLKVNSNPEISADVVYNVLQSTKCFVFKQLNLPEKFVRAFSEIKDWSMNNKEKSILIACKSLCWSKYHQKGSREAEHFIRDAIRENPNCELWYFILAKNLRRIRRDSTIATNPSEEEITSFQKAYSTSSNPVFGVFLAQMYREMRKTRDAEYIYNQIYEQNPEGSTILLRLALGFIRLKNFPKAKVCLDKVEVLSPNHSMYLHYRGVYYMNLKNYKEASKYLKEAIKTNNMPAEKQYVNCAVMLDKSFDVIQYYHNLVSKYSRLPKEQTQPLLLDLALAYYLKKRDVPNAIKYFVQAVEIDPKATCITNHLSSNALPLAEKNLYKLLHSEILLIVRRRKDSFEKSCIDDAAVLQKYCDEYFEKTFDRTLNSFSNLRLRN